MERNLNVDFEIKVNKNGTVAKATMKRLAKALYRDCKDSLNFLTKYIIYWISDCFDKEYCITFYNGDWCYDYSISITLLNSELPVEIQEKVEEVNTSLSFNFDDETSAIDFSDCEYETSFERY